MFGELETGARSPWASSCMLCRTSAARLRSSLIFIDGTEKELDAMIIGQNTKREEDLEKSEDSRYGDQRQTED
jgi:hypothetical protein